VRADDRLVERWITPITLPGASGEPSGPIGTRRTGIVSSRTGTPLDQSGSPSRQIRRSFHAMSSSGRSPLATTVPTTSSW